MNEQWQELKETIIELRDNDGTGTQQEVCKFLANLMDVLERGTSLINDDTVSRQAVLDLLENTNNGWIINKVLQLPPVTPQQKMGHWIDADGDNAICGCCNRLNHLYGTYCKHCGAKMLEVEE